MDQHPKGSGARVLLTSVFGPYARDDVYGSRAINPMELYHNQVTRMQGEFSLRMFHRSWGLMMIQHNLQAASVLLDFPTRKRFARELRRGHYDVVGISAIVTNIGKVAEMCRMVRELSPQSVIVIGGHVTALPDIAVRVDADYFVRGEGIAWMREYLGEDARAPVRHPPIVSGFRVRTMGMTVPTRRGSTSATIVSSVGCPIGCNFCTTSAFFGGKGRSITFYESGDALFEVMDDVATRLRVSSFFVMDENFLLHRKRALRLLELMKMAGKSWRLYVFSSANAITKYSMRELVELGIAWIWMGAESPHSQYVKVRGIDTRELTQNLQSHGIRVLASSIVGLEHHTPLNLGTELAHAVAHGADFHQFMLYTPVPGTPLYREMEQQGRLLPAIDLADIHGQYKFNFRHAAISRDDSKRFLDGAFLADFQHNGPSLFRMCRTLLTGWRRYGQDADERVRQRWAEEIRPLRTAYNAMLWAMERRLRRDNYELSQRVQQLRMEVEAEFGALARGARMLLGPLLLCTSAWEARQLARGATREPPTVVDRRQSSHSASHRTAARTRGKALASLESL